MNRNHENFINGGVSDQRLDLFGTIYRFSNIFSLQLVAVSQQDCRPTINEEDMVYTLFDLDFHDAVPMRDVHIHILLPRVPCVPVNSRHRRYSVCPPKMALIHFTRTISIVGCANRSQPISESFKGLPPQVVKSSADVAQRELSSGEERLPLVRLMLSCGFEAQRTVDEGIGDGSCVWLGQ